MLPNLLLTLLPIPSSIFLTCLTIYHLLPLLTLIPSLSRSRIITSLIPHPRKNNLPREFFNLPPRVGDDRASLSSTVLSVKLGIRGRLVLILAINGLLSLGCGWGFVGGLDDYDDSIGRGQAVLLTLSIIAIPSTILWISFFAVTRGISHSTLGPRIMPLSTSTTALVSLIAIGIPDHAVPLILASSSLLTSGVIGICLLGLYRRRARPIGLNRLGEKCDSAESMEEVNERVVREGSDWLTSPSQASTSCSAFSYSPSVVKIPTTEGKDERIAREGSDWLTSPSQSSTTRSAFSYSPSAKTPKAKKRPSILGSPDSWLSSPSTTPSTLPSWTYSPSIPTPGPVKTRERSASPHLPQPTPHQSHHGSSTTGTPYTASTPGSALSPGGSILADYEPDPFHPLPRGFESLTSYPISPSQLMAGSRISLVSKALRSNDTLAFAPRSTSSTYTIESFHSAHETLITERRAPPPPPIPVNMPLPPTPTASQSGRSWDWQGKESTELLMGDRDWVEIEGNVDGVDGWGDGGHGVGVVALLGILLCYALSAPLLIDGPGDIAVVLYLLSLIIPSPLLILTSYMLRYKPIVMTTRSPVPSISKPSIETHRSLALISNSQLALPISISPKLTPPGPNRSSHQRLSKTILNPKPSVLNFGYVRPERRHTVYGDMAGEEELRRVLARRSGDVWIEAGHAREGGSMFARAAEMLKPVPAMRVLGSPQEGTLTRMRGGVVSMLPRRISGLFEPSVEIKVTSASPEKSRRAITHGSDHAEIQTATRARMSSSPTFIYGPTEQPEYELDWLSAGILPGLVPNIKIGRDIRIESRSPEHTPKGPRQISYRHSIDQTPKSNHRSSTTHGYSTSIDMTQEYFTANQSTPSEFRHRHRVSLPAIDRTDFDDVRKSFDEWGRDDLDLPPFPCQPPLALTPVTEEGSSLVSESSSSSGHQEAKDLDEEEMAEEMERVMAMDTPTRASFVISPPPSDQTFGSYKTSQSGRSASMEIPPVPAIPDVLTQRRATPSDQTFGSYKTSRPTDNSSVDIPPVSLILAVKTHPHPPPLGQPSLALYAPPKPRPLSLIIEPHPPVPNLAHKKSSETMSSSDSSCFTDSSPVKIPAYQFSKKELMLVKSLQSRAAIAGNPPPKGVRKNIPTPLALVDQNALGRSAEIVSGKSSHGENGIPRVVSKDKENMVKTSRKMIKPSTGSGVSRIRV